MLDEASTCVDRTVQLFAMHALTLGGGHTASRPPTFSLSGSRMVWQIRNIFVYDIHMREDEVTEEMIESWVAEAEAGYDVEELKRRGRGRPGRGAEPMQVVAVRLTGEELAALDRVVEREHISRSEAIRQALATYAA